jgi:hypothetical protein
MNRTQSVSSKACSSGGDRNGKRSLQINWISAEVEMCAGTAWVPGRDNWRPSWSERASWRRWSMSRVFRYEWGWLCVVDGYLSGLLVSWYPCLCMILFLTDSGCGYVSCFGQWAINKCHASRSLGSVSRLNLSFGIQWQFEEVWANHVDNGGRLGLHLSLFGISPLPVNLLHDHKTMWDLL